MANGQQIAEALAATLSAIPDCRVHAMPPDSFLGPGIVIQLPTMSWDAMDRTFCTISWTFPIVAVSTRTTDRDAHAELSRLVEAVSDVLAESGDLGGLSNFTRLLNAQPSSISVGGVEYPSYVISVQVLA